MAAQTSVSPMDKRAKGFAVWNAAVLAGWLAVPFALARSATWVDGWIHLGVVVVAGAAESIFVASRNPTLRARRKRIGVGTKTWDLAWNVAF